VENKKSAVKKTEKTKASRKKIAANRRNSKRSTGPRTKTGKLWSRMNALKHGIFASELKVSDLEKPEFELLHRSLNNDLAPATPLQQIGFERVVVSFWRWRRTLRLETKELNAHLEFNQDEQPRADQPPDSVLPGWYGAGNRDLHAGLALLSDLSQDVRANGWAHANKWRDPVTRSFGQDFYRLLTEWLPVDVTAILAARALSGHAKNFDMPLPSSLGTDLSGDQIAVNPNQSWEMGIKLIELRKQHIEDLLNVNRRRADRGNDIRGAMPLDLVTRYVTTATREMERALAWYRSLKKRRL
jgi:hypothetical protein